MAAAMARRAATLADRAVVVRIVTVRAGETEVEIAAATTIALQRRMAEVEIAAATTIAPWRGMAEGEETAHEMVDSAGMAGAARIGAVESAETDAASIGKDRARCRKVLMVGAVLPGKAPILRAAMKGATNHRSSTTFGRRSTIRTGGSEFAIGRLRVQRASGEANVLRYA